MSEALCPRCHAALSVDAVTGPAGPTFRCRACGSLVDPLAILAGSAAAAPRRDGRRLAVVAGLMVGGLAVLIVVFFIIASLTAR